MAERDKHDAKGREVERVRERGGLCLVKEGYCCWILGTTPFKPRPYRLNPCRTRSTAADRPL